MADPTLPIIVPRPRADDHVPAEPVEVQLARVKWDGINKLAATVTSVVLALLLAVQTYYQARMTGRVEQVERRTEATGKAVEDMRANARVMYHAAPAKE